MQNSNDNEIVQYLGVKHIINYLEEWDGLTRAEHIERAFKYWMCAVQMCMYLFLSNMDGVFSVLLVMLVHKERIRSNRVITSIKTREWIYYWSSFCDSDGFLKG